MTAITLTREEFEKINFLLRDINTIQKLNKVFDIEAIDIFKFKILAHLNIEDTPSQKLDCPYDFTSRCTMGSCDCKPKQETTSSQTERMYSEVDMIKCLKHASIGKRTLSFIQSLKQSTDTSSQTEISINELKGICQSVIDNTPSDATEKEIGYTKAMEHIIKIIDGEPNKYSQTEISDEEIEKSALEFFADYKGGASQWEISAFIMGMKKYREQLKSRQ